jgi:hypothetical protein
MAVTALTITDISRAGAAYSPAAANADGHTLANTSSEFVIVTNADSGAHTITAAITQTVDGVTPAGKTLSVPAGASRAFGPFPTGVYGSSVTLTFDAVTSVTIQALRLTASI